MKKGQIIGLVFLAVAIGLVIIGVAAASPEIQIKDARALAAKGSKKKVTISETRLVKQNGKVIIDYKPQKDPNLCKFKVVDKKGDQAEVIYFQPKPQDIERSETLTITGMINPEDSTQFLCEKVIMKCPSKYKAEEEKQY